MTGDRMLPDRAAAPSPPLPRVIELFDTGAPRPIRVLLRDGSIVEGELTAISPAHLSLLSSHDQLQYVPLDQVGAVYVGARRTLREFLLVAGVTGATTALLVAAAQLPFLRAHLRAVAVPLCAAAVALLLMARKSVRLGGWLTSWEEIDASGGGRGPGT